MEISTYLQRILDNLPHKPGVYLMKDADGTIIYVGKSKELFNRVRSYFHRSITDEKTRRLRENIADIEFIVTGAGPGDEEGELEALRLENTLIKRHKPHYNIALKDDKQYPYIKVTWGAPFPTVEFTRRMVQDGSRYFGPFSARSIRNTLDVLRKIFPYLTCDREITGNDSRACLYYDIKLCTGPCIGAVDQTEYRAMIQQLMRFLEGHTDEVLRDLEWRMESAAEALQFERAARYRDQIRAINSLIESRRVINIGGPDQDVIGYATSNGDALVQVFFVRQGKLIGRESYPMENVLEEDTAAVIESFVQQYYDRAAFVPPEIMLPVELEGHSVLERWLKGQRGGKRAHLHTPRRGKKRELVQMANDNAAEALSILKVQWQADTLRQEGALRELQAALDLPTVPNRIECYDISTTQGTAIVASRVVFLRGTPRKSEYRRFNINSVDHEGSDDYQSMREALTRRFKRYVDTRENPTASQPGKKDQDETWRLLPDLLIVDGGKGQLNVAVEVLTAFDLLNKVPVAGLAKQNEELFLPGRRHSILLNRRSPALFLVQRVRDEAHRFAITSHRQRRAKQSLASQLETIPGIGPKRRKLLLEAFDRSIQKLRQADVEAIAAVPGIGPELAQIIK
ncbi:MAG: excinuclease ABC subunit UvrC, partial [Anaerolineae bacterium]|nr:excinuclease ABC subunit UvrC [Anaerolineae bacterium]